MIGTTNYEGFHGTTGGGDVGKALLQGLGLDADDRMIVEVTIKFRADQLLVAHVVELLDDEKIERTFEALPVEWQEKTDG